MPEITCTLFNLLTQQSLGDVKLVSVPRVGEYVLTARSRAFEVVEVWHVGSVPSLVVKEVSTGLPTYLKGTPR